MLETLINRPCQILKRLESTTEDRYGNGIPDEAVIDTVCELQQRRRDEPDDQGELSDTYWDLFLPAGTDVNTGDVLIVDGDRYELFGDPWQARNPRTRVESHIEATVRRTASAGDAEEGS